LDPEGSWLVGSIVTALIREEESARNIKIDAVGGLTMGADPIALAAGMVSFRENPQRPIDVFVVRKSPKTHGQNKLVEGNFSRGDSVVVIDDVVTKGDSTLKAIESVEAEGGLVKFVIVLLDREEGGRQKIEARGVPVISVFRKRDVLPEAANPPVATPGAL
jgi:orotate phosphoribosyltransferase